ncbi:MAG: DNA polymerase III subunit alpha [Bacteroidia bacterium]|nr:DNA polymerase III subunit alpha [Bacteroidia bacterium]
MYLVFDTETTGLPKRWNAPVSDLDNWPRCIQIAWQLHDQWGEIIEHNAYLIQPEGFDVPYDAEKIHGISTALATEEGLPLEEVLDAFTQALARTTFVVGQNVSFDLNIMGSELLRAGRENSLEGLPVLDTCTEETALLCQIPGGRGGKFKLPTLTELHEYLFQQPFDEAHNATADVEATSRCFFELIRLKHYPLVDLKANPGYLEAFLEKNPDPIELVGLTHTNLKEASAKLQKDTEPDLADGGPGETHILSEELNNSTFVHLHNHSQFSVLQSTTRIHNLVARTGELGMPAVALTDHGNMMGAFRFIREVNAYNKKLEEDPSGQTIKPILGCEFFVCEDHTNKRDKDYGYQMVFLAKNKKGYHNLAKMSSLAFTDGFYYVPRIDKKIVESYKEDLIVLTGNLYGEVSAKILNQGERQAEEALLWWKELFGDDLYVEMMRHGQEDEKRANASLLSLARKHNVNIVATNNTYYLDKADANAHDILLCVKEGEKQATPIGRGRGYRYGFPNQEYYFKSAEDMKTLFSDLPEAILNIENLLDKIEAYTLEREVLLPKFSIPQEFKEAHSIDSDGIESENRYLRHITLEGAKERYETIKPEIQERIDFELQTIANSGYPGYFLIVEDFIREARNMGVSVGPGRGSAAGSVVAYCLRITNIDPLKYDLLFERFLNPDRVSMPDIDIDFDDEGRAKVMDYVINKYGANQVAQIITYGTMAAKSAIRDTARVLDLPLNEADRLAKLVPNMTKLAKVFESQLEDLKKNYRSEDLRRIQELIGVSEGQDLQADTVNLAKSLEGSLRNTGIHACGVIITPDDITNFVPIATAKDSDLYVTQWDNAVVENAGLLKMDFLGLKTLTLIKDTVKIVKARHEIDLDPDAFPLDDEKTYQLFQRGETVGIFQYESVGMQKHLKELKPTVFDDLIAMNALYRPGPMEYIPQFIDRKHGKEEITYDLPVMEEILKDTYGITVYQEQVMLLSQKLASFSKGDADVLRKAMGKKIFALLQKLKPQFLDGGEKNGHPRDILEKIWKDWEAFASYAFNKSHSTCYAYIAYQTAYLKAHYPSEYMAAVLSNNMNDIKQVTFFMEECKRMGLEVLGPDVNESWYKFAVNKDNAVRFGMGAIKGVGQGAVKSIVSERKANGPFSSVFDMAKRADLRAANKKAFENLALAGAFDSLGQNHRAQYFHQEKEGVTFLEKVLRYGARFQENENSAQVSLFGEASDVQIPEPVIPPCEPWSMMEKLRREKEVVGIYISGHPLDEFKSSIQWFCNGNVSMLTDLNTLVNKEVSLAGIITDVQHRVSKNGKGWAIFTLEDYTDTYDFRIFGEEYLKFRHFLMINSFVYFKIFIRDGWVNRETGKKGEPRLQYTSVMLLQDVMETFAKKLTLQLSLDQVKEETVTTLKKTLASHKGKQSLHFTVFEMTDNMKVNLNSRKQRIAISAELLEELEANQIYYKIN